MGAQLSQGYTDRPTSTLGGLAQGGQAFATGYQDKINQAKQAQLGDAKYQHMQAQMEAERVKIKAAQDEQAYQAKYGEWQQNPVDSMGFDIPEPLSPQRAMARSDFSFEQAEEAKNPDPLRSRPSSPIQNFAERQRLVKAHGEGSPQVKRFDDYVRATQYKDTGKNITQLSPTAPPTNVAPIELGPEQEPEHAQEVAMAKAVGGAIGAELGQAEAMLDVMTANMPELESAVVSMGNLGDKATYNWAGRIGDEGSKQLGEEPTEGALARAEYVSRARQEILPLLRLTFGAAFTEKEGDKLMETLADADAHPKVKRRILAAFIEKKRNQIKSLQRQTGKTEGESRKKKYGLE